MSATTESADATYVITSTSSSVTAAGSAKKKAPESDRISLGGGRRRRNPDGWFSGWCGPGPCRDGVPDDDGIVRRHCRGIAENGSKVTPRYVLCRCACHGSEPGAAHPRLPQEVASPAVAVGAVSEG